ncbi:MAG TPA: flagellar protein FlaG [Candidatus Hydrogenedentes bacterium]|nr:flagellar protein FlaG [Candidatus Hydrogenedentota bacterium]HOJ67945.1 flagellar protein FlaG [Candidatus Hydrogenedentota bacterium]HOK90854.1 flagellar protein FlaG [Candidatus Hydrogenedentota bacterium]
MDISRITGMGAPRPADAVPSGRAPAPRPESSPDPARSGEVTRQVESLRKPQVEPEPEKQDQREAARTEERRNPQLPQVSARIRFEETLNRPIIQFLDENRQVIRQYPPEALVQFSLRFRELQQRLFDQRG